MMKNEGKAPPLELMSRNDDPPTGETVPKADRSSEKRERFLRLTETRTTAVLQKLRVLGNCANKQNYDYTAEDIARIRASIIQQLDRTLAKFETDRDVEFKW